MPKVKCIENKDLKSIIPEELLIGKRHLLPTEIYTLIQNKNTSSDPDWQNIWVSDKEGEFNPNQIIQSDFRGYVILGSLKKVTLTYHDLELDCGIYRSSLKDVVVGDDFVIHNVNYLQNFRLGNRVLLFNIQEMSCTNHSKFGEGILKEGEDEKNRIWVEIGNENGNRSVLAFTDMIPADAYLWSRYREDSLLMSRFVQMTEFNNTRTNDTFGYIADDVVIKNCTLIKDVRVGNCAYIKGAFKLKNLTILSSEDEPSQIGEGVEMVNGIMGYGCHVFYQAIAVRFVMGRNCQLKYGARLLNSVLGDNSVVSCCEALNNLIFPFHEQHHNSSFLIASTLMGQSNVASAATIGSNHNSRSPDCEMIAGRGFWPGLCSDFKFDSKFSSFVLVSKGSYQYELNITYPFSMVAEGKKDSKIIIIPAYWFLYNMFAIVRNKYKFKARDKRKVVVQNIETNPIAPDSCQEIEIALERLVELTSRFLILPREGKSGYIEENNDNSFLLEYEKRASDAKDEEELKLLAKEFLEKNTQIKFVLYDDRCQKKFGAEIHHVCDAYNEYRKILKYFFAELIVEWMNKNQLKELTENELDTILHYPLFTNWLNVGGQIIPEEKINSLFTMIKNHEIEQWTEVHDFYFSCQEEYLNWKLRYSLYLLEKMYSKSIKDFTPQDYLNFVSDVKAVAKDMLESSYSTREKDYSDFFRSITFRNEEEKTAVLGSLKDNSFLKELTDNTKIFCESIETMFSSFFGK